MGSVFIGLGMRQTGIESLCGSHSVVAIGISDYLKGVTEM